LDINYPEDWRLVEDLVAAGSVTLPRVTQSPFATTASRQPAST
jgi:hypothetical protein